jgi:hypothetical protein
MKERLSCAMYVYLVCEMGWQGGRGHPKAKGWGSLNLPARKFYKFFKRHFNG